MANYTANIYPILEGKCAGCHTSAGNANFCAATAAGSYSAIVALPAVVGTFVAASAPVLTKIAGGHQGVTYATVESDNITTWLNLEKAARP